MKKIEVSRSVAEAAVICKQLLLNNGFTVFCDIDHQHNAAQVGMTLPAARTLVFGKPEAGTKLMQQDIHTSFDLPLRVAVVENKDGALLIHPQAIDFATKYALDETHPVLEAVDSLFGRLADKLNTEA